MNWTWSVGLCFPSKFGLNYHPTLTDKLTPCGYTDEFLSAYPAKTLSAESRVWFPSHVGSLLSLGQRFVAVNFLPQRGRSTLLFVHLLMSAGRHGLAHLKRCIIGYIHWIAHGLKPSIECVDSVSTEQMITAPALLLCSVSLIQALVWLQHKSTFHHSWKYEQSLWDWREI